jgi:hypothetical protein
MGIVNDQTLHAILHEQRTEEGCAFTPASPRGEAQSGQEKVAQRRFTRSVLGSGHCQQGLSPPTNRPRQALRLIPQIAKPHRLARTRLCHHDLPAPRRPRLT